MAASATTFQLINTDKISTWMGAPPHHWKPNEVQQIKQIHRCFRNAYNHKSDLMDEVKFNDRAEDHLAIQFDENMAMVVKDNEIKKPKGERSPEEAEEDQLRKDEEDFLPRDSPLRSKNADKKIPANPTFKDYEAFLNSCSYDFWRHNFERQAADKFLSETAQSIVANICQAQSRNELRVRNGHVPLRKKREHITPLALVLHEIKLWATNVLRTADVYNEDTYQEIKCRTRYLDALAHKEVWGDSVIIFGAGMNATAHDRLFRLFLSAKEGLDRAHEYSLRGYNRRSSREKLSRAGNLLKDLVLNEMRMLSGRMTLTKKLQDPKTARLQPSDLLNSIENQPFVDYLNMVNVILWRLCQNALVQATLTGDYEKPDVKEEIQNLIHWSENNLFCKPNGADDMVGEPDYRMDQKREFRMMPEVYRPTAAQLKRLLREVDPKAVVPQPTKTHIALLRKCFQNDEAAHRIVKLMMKNLAAIQDLIPSIYAMHQLWTLAGDGGDFTVYDTMREHVIRVMTNTVSRVKAVKDTGLQLSKLIGRLAAEKEQAMTKEAIAKKKMSFKPAWVMNHRFIAQELSGAYDKTYKMSFARLYEIAKDARDYTLTTDVLDDKVEEAKKIFDAITGYHAEKDKEEKIEETVKEEVAEVKKKEEKNWIRADDKDLEEFGKNNVFGDNSGASDGGFNFDDAESFNPFAANGADYDSDAS